MKTLAEKNEAIAILAGFKKTDSGWLDSEGILNNQNKIYDKLCFDFDWNWLNSFIVYVENNFGYGLVIYPNECYWLDDEGDYIFDETFTGERTEAVFDACFCLANKMFE